MRSGRFPWPVAFSLILLTLPASCGAALTINEVLYDPLGPDSGREFVEIANSGPYAATLEWLVLEAGNGSHEDDWEEVWAGSEDRWIEPGGVYRIGLDGPGQGEPAELGLQNGPDGVRLLKQGFEMDRVGWGTHQHKEYYEGHPAPGARAGQSLSRRRDGVDTDDNAADFEEMAPSPGRPNHPDHDWALRIARPVPELPRPLEPILLRLLIVNRGVEERTPPPAEVIEPHRTILVGWDSDLPPGAQAEADVVLEAPADTGRFLWRARLVAGDQIPENDADSLALRVGPGPLRIMEILSAPGPGEPEWIEIGSTTPMERVFDGLVLDVRGNRIRLARRAFGPESTLALVVEDSLQMRSRHPELPASAIWPYEGAWPRLRNGERSGGISDTLRLSREDGLTLELALPGPSPGDGVSLERLDVDIPEGPATWLPCSDPSGSTPGRPAKAFPSVSGETGLHARPRIVQPGSTSCTFEGDVGSQPGEVRLELFDLYGRSVRCLLRDLWAAGRIAAVWDGRDESGADAPPGVLIAILEVDRGRNEAVQRWKTAVAVSPGGER